MEIGVVGLGLIGGSLAKAVKLKTDHRVFAMDQDENVVQEAIRQGDADSILCKDSLSRCDILLIALYPIAAIEYVEKAAPLLKPGTIIIDMCGVKRVVAKHMQEIASRNYCIYIGGHPMAGREHSGYRWADGELFCGASMILTPQEVPETALQEAEAFF